MKRIFSLILTLMAVQMMWAAKISESAIPEIDLTSDNFYVKENGDGDGSSWEKAMGQQTFAYYLPQVKDGTTFHVAAGTYYPMYDNDMKLTNDRYAQYTIKSDVTIKGGYPANAANGAKSNPKEYKTIFSGDFGNDDEVEFVKEKSIEFRNYEDNAISLFKILVSKNINVSLEGCVLSHCSSESVYMYEMVFDNFLRNISFNNVVFESIKGDVIFLSVSSDKHDKVNLSVDHSSFYHNNQCISATLSSINVRNTVFEENGSLLTGQHWNENCQTVIDSCIFGSNLIGLRSWNDLTIKNSTFDSNNSSNLINMQGYDQVLNIYNSKFIKNKTSQTMIYSQNIAMIENCSFISNETGSQIAWVKDLTVNHSYVYDHKGTGVFYVDDNLSLNSDTIESCKCSGYMVTPCENYCRIDSCLMENNDSYLFYLKGNFELRNSEIIENFKTDMNSEIPIISLNSKSEDDRVNVVNTIFEDNKYKDCVFLKNEGTFSFNFDHCLSDSNESSQYFDLSNPKSNILNSTFDNCLVTNGSLININGGASLRSENSSYVNNTTKIDILHKVNDDILNNLGDSLILRNNTIAKNTSENIIYEYSSVYSAYMNNTIVGNMVSSPGLPIKREAYCDSFDFVGNIILGNGSDVYEKNTSNYIYPDGLSVVLQLSDKTANITYNLSTILRSFPYTSSTDNSTWKPSNNTNLLIKPYLLDNESGCIICPYSLDELE